MIANHPAITPYKEALVPHLVATLIYLAQNYSYYIRGDRSPLRKKYIHNHSRDKSLQGLSCQ